MRRINFHIIVLVVLLILVPFTTKAQNSEYLFTNLDVSDGLSHNLVFDILKDSRGYMWFGTMDGLNRYDGYGFKVWRHKHDDTTSLASSSITNLFEDSDGRIWLQMSINIADPTTDIEIYDPETESILHDHPILNLNIKIPQEGVVKILEDPSGAMWFAHFGNGLYRVNPEKNYVTNLRNIPGDKTSLQSNLISDLEIDSKGNIWVVTNDCMLECLDRESLKVIRRIKLPGFPNPMYWFYIDRDDDIWVFPTNNILGVLFYDQSEDQLLHFDNQSEKGRLKVNDVIDIVEDSAGRIWIGTDHGGINILDKSDFSVEYVMHNPANEKSLAQNILRSLYVDDEGIIWLGTFKKGISYFHPKLFKFNQYVNNPEDESSLPFNDILCFMEDADRNIWIGTDGGGLIKMEREDEAFTQYTHDPNDPASLSRDVVIDLHEDPQGRIWIATYYGGLNVFDGKKFRSYRSDPGDPTTLSEDRIWDIFQDSKGRMWIGTLERGLNLFDPETGKVIRHYSNTDGSFRNGTNVVFTILEDDQGFLWLASAYGIFRFDPDTDTFIQYTHNDNDPNSLSNPMCFDILIDSENRLWAATADGLNLFNSTTGEFRVFREEDGLASNYLVSIAEDQQGNLWLGTSKGLSNLSILNTGNDSLRFKITNYDESDGLMGRELNENASCLLRSGELLFGGPDGFVRFDPRDFVYADSPAKTVFTNLRIFNRPVGIEEEFNGRVILDRSLSYTSQIELKFSENLFTLDFATLDYFQPDKHIYQYQLEGFNDNWLTLDPGIRNLTLTNLDPGQYLLRVRSLQANRETLSTEAVLAIVIKPPFWRTIWFRVIFAASVLTLIVAWYLKRIRDLENQKVELKNLVEERTTEIREKNEELLQQTEVLNDANRLLEERRQQIEEQTEELMAQKNELEDTNNHLRELNSTKDRFFSIIAHDIKNPFQNVLGFAELLEEQFDTLAEEKKKKFINAIFVSATSVFKLLENLLQWARSQTNQLKVQKTRIEIDHLIKNSIGVIENNAAEKNITIHYSPVRALVYADPDMIGTVIRNLLSNAVKFTPTRGNIYIDVSSEDGNTVVAVRDTGVGIEMKDIAGLFSVDNTYSTVGTSGETGTGLGLILCKEFINRNNGEIRVTSEVGKGSTFSFSLPEN